MPRGPKEGVEVLLYSFFNLGARWGGDGRHHTPAALSPGKRPRTYCTGGWIGPRAGLDECENSRLSGIRSPDRPAP